MKLGLVLEAVDLGQSGESNEDNFPFVIDACLIPQPEYLDEELLNEAISEGALTREEQIRYIYECYGGVPVNIDAVQPAKASCGFSSFVAESSIGSVKVQSGEEIDMRHFQDLEEAMIFARDFYAAYAHVLIGFIDVVLDSSLRTGETGWDKIRKMAKK